MNHRVVRTLRIAVAAAYLQMIVCLPCVAQDGVCARVGVRLEQEAVITRNAFRATLTLDNAGDEPLTGIGVALDIRDPDGNPANDRFGIFPPTLTGLTGVDGGGVLGPGQSGTAAWTIVPTDEAAPTEPLTYGFGGTLTYTTGGGTVTIPFVPEHLAVLPNPSLRVKYFWERDVFSDDPFTPEVEPAQPFSIGLMMTNAGYGTAHNVRVTSAQPRITDNERGLVISFQLIGAQVGEEPISPALNVNLGDIGPGGVAVARWLMTSSLQGHFIGYSATYEHLDGLGDPRLSLIDSLDIYPLVRAVRTQEEGDDRVPDFLTDETAKGEDPDDPDRRGLPDTLHLSDGTVHRGVHVILDPVVSTQGFTATVTVPSSAKGPAYIKFPDPFGGAYRLVRAVRDDGRVLDPEFNVWQTDRTYRTGQAPLRLHRVHLFDRLPGGGAVYTLTFEPDTLAPSVTAWRASTGHGDDLPFVALSAAQTPEYCEARAGGVRDLLVEFSEPIASATFTPENVVIAAVGLSGAPIDLAAAGVSWTTSISDGGTSGRISFTGRLPDAARYCVTLVGVQDLQGNPLIENRRLVFTVLEGDATGDRRVNNTDVGAVLSLRGTEAIDPGNPNHVRADVNRDGRIDQADVDRVLSLRRLDARFIPDPCLRGMPGIGGDDDGGVGPDGRPSTAAAGVANADRPGGDGPREGLGGGGDGSSVRYRFGGQWRSIPLDPSRLAIRAIDSQADVVQLLIDARIPVAASPAPYPGWWFVDLAPEMAESGPTRDLAAALRDAGLYVSPVLVGEDGGPMWIPSEVLVRAAGVDPADAVALIADAAPRAMILESDLAGIDGLWLIDSGAESGWAALEIANSLAEREAVDLAEADMIFSGRNSALARRSRPVSDEPRFVGEHPAAALSLTRGAPVVILDDGVDLDHPRLPSVRGRDFTFQAPGRGEPRTDLDAHGTALAGCVADAFARGAAQWAGGPRCECDILSARILVPTGPDGEWIGRPSWTVRALGWARAEGARVSLNSNRYGFRSSAVAAAYERMRAAGMVHISMAGNAPDLPVCFPADLECVLAVGSVDGAGRLSAFCSRGPGIDLVARGEGITTLDRCGAPGYTPGDTVEVAGTSFAAAYAAGLAALVASIDPSCSPGDVERTLRLACEGRGEDAEAPPGVGEVRAELVARAVRLRRADLTGDGEVTAADVAELGCRMMSPASGDPVDVNGDGKFDAADLQAVLELLTGRASQTGAR